MGLTTGTVVNQTIATFKGAGPFRILDVQLLGDNPAKVIWFGNSGEDFAPYNGDQVIVFDLGGGFKIALKTNDQIDPSVDEGEKEIYSHDGSSKKAYIKWKASGDVEVNGNSKSAVRYEDLATAFNTLKSDLNSFVSIFNAHVHTTVTGLGAPTPPAVPGTPSSADIAPSESSTVKLP